eukprot:Rhum_TRINITY_DN3170_c0_g1::Rhum_TRINITY_DN3170_c0_g1_i1::g.9694::m.9694
MEREESRTSIRLFLSASPYREAPLLCTRLRLKALRLCVGLSLLVPLPRSLRERLPLAFVSILVHARQQLAGRRPFAHERLVRLRLLLLRVVEPRPRHTPLQLRQPHHELLVLPQKRRSGERHLLAEVRDGQAEALRPPTARRHTLRPEGEGVEPEAAAHLTRRVLEVRQVAVHLHEPVCLVPRVPRQGRKAAEAVRLHRLLRSRLRLRLRSGGGGASRQGVLRRGAAAAHSVGEGRRRERRRRSLWRRGRRRRRCHRRSGGSGRREDGVDLGGTALGSREGVAQHFVDAAACGERLKLAQLLDVVGKHEALAAQVVR